MTRSKIYTLLTMILTALQSPASDYLFSSDKGIMFQWKENDEVCSYTTAGSRLYGVVTSSSQTDPLQATVSLCGWSTKPYTKYYAYAPYDTRHVINGNRMEDLPILYTGQKQTTNGSTAHLAAYDFMMGEYTTGDTSADISLRHLSSFIRIEWPYEGDKAYRSLTLSADDYLFTFEASMDLTRQTVVEKRKTKAITLALDNVEASEDNPLVTYIALYPDDLTGKSILLSLVTADGIERVAIIQGTALKAGMTYPVTIDFSHRTKAKAQPSMTAAQPAPQAATTLVSTLSEPTVKTVSLPIDTDNRLVFDDQATAIAPPPIMQKRTSSADYSLSGIRLTTPKQRQPIISNGRKIIRR